MCVRCESSQSVIQGQPQLLSEFMVSLPGLHEILSPKKKKNAW